MRGKVRVAIAGVGNCASALIQGVQFYRDADPAADVPGPHACRSGRLPCPRRRVLRRLRRGRPARSAATSPTPSWPQPNNTCRFADVPALGVEVRRGPTLDGLGRYLRGLVPNRAPSRTTSPAPCARPGPTCSSAICPSARRRPPAGTPSRRSQAGCAFVNCIPVFIASRRGVAPTLRRGAAAPDRRRHQVPGRRHHRAPAAGQPVPRARRAAGPHLPAQFRRQHRLPQHARARPAGIRRRSPRRRPSPASSATSCRRATSMSGRAITCPGSPTANSATSASKAPLSATCR